MVWTFAHQGGWDEILMFVVPVLAALWAVRRAERRRSDDEPLEHQHSDEAGSVS